MVCLWHRQVKMPILTTDGGSLLPLFFVNR
ncbi:hypothetical protein [Clostridium phage Amboise]|nr:hypothetical protein [Clostridium phage Amboise]